MATAPPGDRGTRRARCGGLCSWLVSCVVCELLHTGTGLTARGTTLLAVAHMGLDHSLVLLAMTGRTRPDLLGTSTPRTVLPEAQG